MIIKAEGERKGCLLMIFMTVAIGIVFTLLWHDARGFSKFVFILFIAIFLSYGVVLSIKEFINLKKSHENKSKDFH